jgi:2-keto-4-pentenoate hydratase
LGSELAGAAEPDFASRTVQLTQDGVVVSTGRGWDCLGSPLDARPGSKYAAQIDSIGSVEVSFAEVMP